MFNKKTATTAKNSAEPSGTKASHPSSSAETSAPAPAPKSSSSFGECGCRSGGRNVNYEPPLNLKKHGLCMSVFKPREHEKTFKSAGGQALYEWYRAYNKTRGTFVR